MRDITVKILTFDELSKDAQERAISEMRADVWLSSICCDNAKEDTKYLLTELGFAEDDIDVMFSLNSCQGDGLSFTVSAKPLNWWIERNFVDSSEVAKIAEEYRDVVEIAFKRNDSRYVHEHTVYVDENLLKDIPQEDYDKIADYCKELNKWRANKCRELAKSADSIVNPDDEFYSEFIKGNEYEFYENGEYCRD